MPVGCLSACLWPFIISHYRVPTSRHCLQTKTSCPCSPPPHLSMIYHFSASHFQPTFSSHRYGFLSTCLRLNKIKLQEVLHLWLRSPPASVNRCSCVSAQWSLFSQEPLVHVSFGKIVCYPECICGGLSAQEMVNENDIN